MIILNYFALFGILLGIVVPRNVSAHGGSHTSVGNGTTDESLIGFAFDLTFLGAASTSLGAALPFVDSILPFTGLKFRVLSSKGFLAGSLGAAAGVLLYGGFSALLPESTEMFAQEEGLKQHASILSFVFFFIGVGIIITINHVVHWLNPDHTCVCNHSGDQGDGERVPTKTDFDPKFDTGTLKDTDRDPTTKSSCCASEAITEIQNHKILDVNTEPVNDVKHAKTSPCICCKPGERCSTGCEKDTDLGCQGRERNLAVMLAAVDETEQDRLKRQPRNMSLERLGIQSAAAIALHNIPEGMATFIAATQSMELGAIVTFAIILHNIPEGFGVAMPIYIATGSKWKGFAYATFVAGMAEPLGGLIAYLLLSSQPNFNFVSAILFSITAGMLVYMALGGFLPNARFMDKSDKYVTKSVFFGIGFLFFGISLLHYT